MMLLTLILIQILGRLNSIKEGKNLNLKQALLRNRVVISVDMLLLKLRRNILRMNKRNLQLNKYSLKLNRKISQTLKRLRKMRNPLNLIFNKRKLPKSLFLLRLSLIRKKPRLEVKMIILQQLITGKLSQKP